MEDNTFKIELPLFDTLNYGSWLSLATYETPLDSRDIFENDSYCCDIEDDSIDIDDRLIAKEYQQSADWFDENAYKTELLSLANTYTKKIGFCAELRKLGMVSLIGVKPVEVSSPMYYNYSNDKGIWEIEYPSEELFWEELLQASKHLGLQNIADTNPSHSGYISFTDSTAEGFGQGLAQRKEQYMAVALQELAAQAVHKAEEASVDKGIFDYGYGTMSGFIGFVLAAIFGEIPNHHISYSSFMTMPPNIAALDDETKRKWVESDKEVWKLQAELE